ncbi:MAG: response regulator transcription factor [Planctomycetota bacterium]|nr:response regulator transcription factor [Planctomycetota bacterium]
MRVLVVEDYEPLRKSLVQGLEEAGLAVDSAAEGEQGLWYARSNDYDAIVLDIMLPKLDGLAILKRLRQDGSQAPILLLTAKDTVEDRVEGLNLGADDYLVKPFAFDELLARVRAMMRRRYEKADPVIRIEDLEVNTSTRSVRRGDRAVALTAREYALLELLAMRAGEVVSRTDIWEHLYEFHSSAESNVVDVYIGYLRRKLEPPDMPKLIHTRRGQGYTLGGSN